MAGRTVNKATDVKEQFQTTAGQGFDPKKRPQPTSAGEGCDRTSSSTTSEPRPSAFRVESANALALATRANNQELQAVLTSAIEAQRNVAKQTAQVVESLMSGEFLHQQIQAELVQLQQPKAPVNVEFETFDPVALLGSGGRDVVKALPGAGA